MKLDIEWTDDCQGKKDYDGCLLAVSTRYWPGPITVFDGKHPEKGLHEIPGGRPSAKCSISIYDGFANQNGEHEVLASGDFEGDSFEEVAEKVQTWAQEQANRAYKALQAEFSA